MYRTLGISKFSVLVGQFFDLLDVLIYWSKVLTERFSILYKNRTKENASFRFELWF